MNANYELDVVDAGGALRHNELLHNSETVVTANNQPVKTIYTK